VTASYLACPRCSFFLSGYKLIQLDFNEAVETSNDGWLDFSWSHDTRLLVQKTYGNRIDMDTLHYEGVCRECQRVYIFDMGEDGEDAHFRIEIVPG
jgi:hypothetical protein